MQLKIFSFLIIALLLLTMNAKAHAAKRSVHSEQNSASVWLEVDGASGVQANSVVDVRLKISRNMITEAPMKLVVKLPEGATLELGLISETIIDAQSSEIEKNYRIRIGQVPVGDVLFEMLTGTGPVVTRSEAAYRFGRPEPKLPTPATSGPITLNGMKIYPVMITPPQTN